MNIYHIHTHMYIIKWTGGTYGKAVRAAPHRCELRSLLGSRKGQHDDDDDNKYASAIDICIREGKEKEGKIQEMSIGG